MLCKVMKCVWKYVFVLNSFRVVTKTCAPNVHAQRTQAVVETQLRNPTPLCRSAILLTVT